MNDPTSTGAGKIAQEMMREVQSAMKQADQVSQAQQPGAVQFNDTLQAQQLGQVQATDPTRLNPANTSDVLRAARDAQGAPRVPAIGNSIDTRPLVSGLHRMMEDVMSGQHKLEQIINMSLSGKNFSTSELLAMQAGVYRFTQELELTSKVVEKATSTIKQTMNTQV